MTQREFIIFNNTVKGILEPKGIPFKLDSIRNNITNMYYVKVGNVEYCNISATKIINDLSKKI